MLLYLEITTGARTIAQWLDVCLYTTNLVSGIPNGHLSLARVIPECRVWNNPSVLPSFAQQQPHTHTHTSKNRNNLHN